MHEGLDSKENAQLELVAEVYRSEVGYKKTCVGQVFQDSTGKRSVKWAEGFDPELALMVEVPVNQNDI